MPMMATAPDSDSSSSSCLIISSFLIITCSGGRTAEFSLLPLTLGEISARAHARLSLLWRRRLCTTQVPGQQINGRATKHIHRRYAATELFHQTAAHL